MCKIAKSTQLLRTFAVIFFSLVPLTASGETDGNDFLCPEMDLNGDCFVDFADVALLAGQWLQGGTECPGGYFDCDGIYENGCETNISSDPNNCGDCNSICPNLAHAVSGCQDGNCVIASCQAGWDNCDGNPANGCETDIYTNVNHCGYCNHVCTFPHAAATCVGGNCTLGACDSGYGNCDGNPANGCETNLNDGGGTCAGATQLGTVCGDAYTGFMCTSYNCEFGPYVTGKGEKWYKIYLQECETSGLCSSDLHLWVRLDPPAGTDYDLYVYQPCGTMVGSSAKSGDQIEQVHCVVNDSGGDDSRYYYIEIRYYTGSSCGEWLLETWGGCESGP